MKTYELYSKIDIRIINSLNALVLISALSVTIDLSYNILTRGFYDPESNLTLKIQMAVCSIFILDYLFRLAIAKQKMKYAVNNMLLLLFSIPYLNIVHYSGVELPQHIHYFLTLIPVLRAGFGMIMIVRWYNRRKSTRLFYAYLIVLMSMVYFSTLLFFIVERGVNPAVHTFWDALWWAMMDTTTVGSNIIAVTPIGKILSVLLASMGIMMLPVFMVFVTDKMQADQTKENSLQQNDSKQ